MPGARPSRQIRAKTHLYLNSTRSRLAESATYRATASPRSAVEPRSGAAQVVELVWQLEGRYGARQVPAARLGLAHNVDGWIGLDVACACIHVLHR